MNPVSAPVLPLGTLPQSHGTPRDQLAKAARQFEAIFVRQMLSEARKTNLGGDSLLGGQGLDTFRQMQDDRFAELAANTGAFGLARMIEAQLAAQVKGSA
ncbi:MAG: rod-binding protein [Novosphingobium sp.]